MKNIFKNKWLQLISLLPPGYYFFVHFLYDSKICSREGALPECVIMVAVAWFLLVFFMMIGLAILFFLKSYYHKAKNNKLSKSYLWIAVIVTLIVLYLLIFKVSIFL
jgi:hypothetical protein